MYKGKSVIALIPAHNEYGKIAHVVERISREWIDEIVVIDDASTDDTAESATSRGAKVIPASETQVDPPRPVGVGAALRTGMRYARSSGFDIAVILAGNNKDDPAQIPRLLDPICDMHCDFVIGSRYLPGGAIGGAMPRYRRFATKLHPFLMGLFSGKIVTESTNGFRALRLSLMDDPRINLEQRWLDQYGLEVYLLWKVLVLGYKHHETPCTKVYPHKSLGYTKMKPVVGWWNILRPVLLLGLGIRE